jgi:hypothetical protein
MISGLARAGSGLGVKEYTERAIQAAHFIQAHLQSQVSREDILIILYLPIFSCSFFLYLRSCKLYVLLLRHTGCEGY